jgi:S-adenosylmethionine-dependent methyltransferase
MAVRIAGLGAHITLLDSSPTMLDLASRAAQDAGVTSRTVLKQGEAAEVRRLFNGACFDLILCHNILEYTEDPRKVLHGAAELMPDSSTILSLVVRNRSGEVFKAAISGDLAAVERNLTADFGRESLFGGTVRLFTPESLCAMLEGASLKVIAARGIRVISDYLPHTVSRGEQYERILELERNLGSRPEFAAVARYRQYFMKRAIGAMESDA